MKRFEAAALLTFLARTDHRTFGDEDVDNFVDLLDDVTLAEAMTAAREHFREDPAWVAPAHIRKRALAARSGHAADKPVETATPDADPDDVAAYQAALRAGRLDDTERVVKARPLAELLAGSFGRMADGGPDAQEKRQAIHREIFGGYSAETARIRSVVMSHPDLRAALTRAPIDYPFAEQWNGYIPPALDHLGRLDSSPRRTVLVAIAAEAERRGGEGAARPPAPQGFIHMPVHRAGPAHDDQGRDDSGETPVEAHLPRQTHPETQGRQ